MFSLTLQQWLQPAVGSFEVRTSAGLELTARALRRGVELAVIHTQRGTDGNESPAAARGARDEERERTRRREMECAEVCGWCVKALLQRFNPAGKLFLADRQARARLRQQYREERQRLYWRKPDQSGHKLAKSWGAFLCVLVLRSVSDVFWGYSDKWKREGEVKLRHTLIGICCIISTVV